jgi:hypothetical protein
MQIRSLLLGFVAIIAPTLVNGWNYTVYNNTPYHMVVCFDCIGGENNPVTMLPASSTTVDSIVHMGSFFGPIPIDYCYAGAHLLITPVANQQMPQVMLNNRLLATTAGTLPSTSAVQQFMQTILNLGGGSTPLDAGFTSPLPQSGSSQGEEIRSPLSFLARQIPYQAPYLPITPALDACWNRTIALTYDTQNNVINAALE